MAEPAPSFIPKEHSAFRSRAITESGGWLFGVGLILCITVLVIIGGLFFYQRSLQATAAQWNEQVQAQEADLKLELLAQVTDLSRMIGVARELLSGHVFASNALLLTQSTVHSGVSLSALSFSRDSRKIELSGMADSYKSVAEQVNLFESHPQVEKVDFGGLSIGERGLVNFKIAVLFRPS
jgi:hypothetical protein